MAHWRLFYHFVWSTKNREPLLTAELRDRIFPYLVGKARHLGTQMLALNGLEDHIHIVAAVPPRIAPADFVKRLKGASSRFISKELGLPFSWQEGYVVYSISEPDVQRVIEYVRAQKEHHRRRTCVPAWESTSGGNGELGAERREH